MNIFSTNFDKEQINEEEWYDFERQFLMPLSLTAIFFALASIFLNIFMGFNTVLIIAPFVSSAVFLVVYFMAKNDYHITLAKWLFIGFTMFIINVIWYYNCGSRGPWFFLLVLLYSYLIFMMSGKQLLILSIVLVINVLALYFFEYTHPDALGKYPNNNARLLDAYSAILLSGASAYVLMTIAKRAYLTQYQKAKMADKLKSSFLANMSHEIRTPLNAIVGFSNLLADGTIKEDEREEYISIINSSNETLLQLIDDILDVSMIEANQVKISREHFSVNELMRNLEKTYAAILSKKRGNAVKLKLNMPKDNYWITSDPIRINQVIINLLNNAVKFTEKGSITFGFGPEDDKLRFFVKDTGIGIEKNHLNYLFDRFYKIEDNNKKLYRGTGIGLYLCKKITEMLGGTIHVKSELGKGSEFYFYLPAKELTIEPVTEISKTSESDLPASGTMKGTVLIIEDDVSSRVYFKKALQGLELKVLEAAGGYEGVKIFRENPDVSVVLLDILLPGVSGFDILKELKKIRPEVPVIAQTAFAMIGDREKCLAAGFDDYISKPVSRKILLELIGKYISVG
jgi:two-component system CheB/CheR fusion protein